MGTAAVHGRVDPEARRLHRRGVPVRRRDVRADAGGRPRPVQGGDRRGVVDFVAVGGRFAVPPVCLDRSRIHRGGHVRSPRSAGLLRHGSVCIRTAGRPHIGVRSHIRHRRDGHSLIEWNGKQQRGSFEGRPPYIGARAATSVECTNRQRSAPSVGWPSQGKRLRGRLLRATSCRGGKIVPLHSKRSEDGNLLPWVVPSAQRTEPVCQEVQHNGFGGYLCWTCGDVRFIRSCIEVLDEMEEQKDKRWLFC
mmetsp:Transcript_36299/g.81616  ORF Transcript_36299/g.81616 Transcript_36299/m.81616 type:complete len:250 (+) Transcript_36299:636-1385(+)